MTEPVEALPISGVRRCTTNRGNAGMRAIINHRTEI